MKTKIGTRVLAIKCANDTTAEVYGYGTYDGDHPCPFLAGGAMKPVTPEEVQGIMMRQAEEFKDMLAHGMIPNEEGQAIANAMIAEYEKATPEDFAARAEQFNAKYANPEGAPNPRITLDSGEVVWGCLCWWGEAEKFDKQLAGKERITVPVPVADGEPEIPDEIDAEAELELAADAVEEGDEEEADPLGNWRTVES